VFRELLQNSDDAGAHSVEIRFETESYLSREKRDDNQTDEEPSQGDLPDLKTAPACALSCGLIGVFLIAAFLSSMQVHQWTFKNDGQHFRDEDWTRLKKIGMQGSAVIAAAY
jgi:hypothetical protein